MVKKLFKYELKYYLKTALPAAIILLSMAIMGRIILFFENDSTPYTIIIGSTVFALYIGILASIIIMGIVAIVRFYKNLFSAEGYLTFTLPITPEQHIFVKLFSAYIAYSAIILTAIISVCIFISGDILNEVIKAIAYICDNLFDVLAKDTEILFHAIGYILEWLLILLIVPIQEFLTVYACISIGQTAKKNRILMSILAYFVYYMAVQVIVTVLMIIFSIMTASGAFDAIALWIENHLFATGHIIGLGALTISAGFSTGCFFITRWIMKHKLNLE